MKFDIDKQDEKIKEKYMYYRKIGFEEKVAIVLTMYTYGGFGFVSGTIDELYDRLTNPKKEHKDSNEEHVLFSTVPKRKGLFGGAVKKESFSIRSSLAACGAMPMMAMNCVSMESQAESCFPSTDEYEPIEEKGYRNVLNNATSTFRMTTNTASAGIVLNQLRSGRNVDKSMVRIEEILNYFKYLSKKPKDDMFKISYEIMPQKDKKLLYINVQGKDDVKEKQNIVVLLDVSGSMGSNNEVTQMAIATVVSKLKEGDKFSLVTYSSEDHTEINSLVINSDEDKIKIIEALLKIKITGCTYGSAGINTAYNIAKKNYMDCGNNQIILITDGDLNFGITSKGGLEKLIEEKKKENVFISVIGTGLYNYKDDKLEVLSKHGNGVYRVVNCLEDVDKSINQDYLSLVNIIAKDVKAQVEFNPEVVESFRLLGFENRELNHEDFSNDEVISEPFGSGGYGVALYEIKLKTDNNYETDLKYRKIVTIDSNELCTVKVRYKKPLEDKSHEIEFVVPSPNDSFTDNAKFAFIIYVASEKLRASDKIGEEDVETAKSFIEELKDGIIEINPDFKMIAEILNNI